MLRRVLSTIVVCAVAIAGVTAIGGRPFEGAGAHDGLGAADQPGLLQAGRAETRLVRPVDARTGHSLPTSFLLTLAPDAGQSIAPPACAPTSPAVHRQISCPGRCVSSGRSSRGPPSSASALFES